MTDPLRPRLLPGVRLVEQLYQGEQAFVVKSPSTGAYFRFRPAEARVIALFDGEHTAAQVSARLAADGLNVPTQSVESFASRLGVLGLVERTLAERSSAQLERLRQDRTKRRRKPLFRGDMFRMRFSVGDPDRLLTRTMPMVRWCFTPVFVWSSLVIFAAYFLLLAARGPELFASVVELTRPSNITLTTGVILWTSFLFIGIVHELGHAYTCKHYSGSVNEMGMMLLYFQPAFYCNVNDAWSFPHLRHRLWVTAAGGWVELLVAAVAAFVWLVTAPGTLVSDTALLVTFLAGGLTLLSNANPLLPYDGYFALTDWLEIPNLRQRATAYFRWWTATRVLRQEREEPPVTERERRVFLIFGACATAYIVLVLTLLATLVLGWATRTFGGVLVSAVMVMLLVRRRDRVRQLWFAIKRSLRELRRVVLRGRLGVLIPERRRGWGALALLVLLVLVLPWSRSVEGEWIAMPLRYSVVTAPIDGIIDELLVGEGSEVTAGAPVLHIGNLSYEKVRPEMARRRDSLTMVAAESRARSLGNALVVEAAAAGANARLRAMESERNAGTVQALTSGTVLTERPEMLIGRVVRAGTPLLQLGATDSLEIRILLERGGATAVAAGQSVSLFLDADAANPIRTVVSSVSPIAAGRAASAGAVEARVRLPASSLWRPGVTGVARVRLGRSTVGGALLWGARTRIRPDLLL
jgi:putative peptide zinc metalloprotease protein